MTKRRARLSFMVFLSMCVFVVSRPLIAQNGLPQVVDVNSSTAGQISVDAPTARFVVVAPSDGGSDDIQVSSIGPGFAPHFRALDPAGAVVIEIANSGSQPTVSGTIAFGAPGVYVIEVSGEQGSVGQFVLTLRVGAPPPPPITLMAGQPVSGTVGSQMPALIYRFAWAGLAGQTVTIMGTTPGVGPAYSIKDDATGRVIATSDGTLEGGYHFLPEASRVYRVEVKTGSGQGDTPFTICLACGSAGLTAIAAPIATMTELPTPVPSELPTASAVPCMVTPSITGAVNIRKGPGTGYGFVGALRAGQSFPAVAQTSGGGWYELDNNGVNGWVSAGGTKLAGDCGALPVVTVTGGAPPSSVSTKPAPASSGVLNSSTTAPTAPAAPTSPAPAVPTVAGPADGKQGSSGQQNNQASGQPSQQPAGQQANVAPAKTDTPSGGQAPPPPPPPPPPLPGKPDLVVSDTGLAIASDPTLFFFFAYVRNVGDGDAGPFTVTVCVVECQNFSYSGLAAGQVVTNPASLYYAHTDAPIEHAVQVDSGNTVDESNESNNLYDRNLGPDDAKPLGSP